MTHQSRVQGGLWGSIVGDALGVPAEFKSRGTLKNSPVRSLIGHGTHNQPAGTWSDDSSLLLCTADSLVLNEFDTDDIGRRFCAWYYENLWTPHGSVFDVGRTTSMAISSISRGTRAEAAGGVDESSNGNGSLMRMIPVALRFASSPVDRLLDNTHRVSAITHGHRRSQIACGIFSLFVRELLSGASAAEALDSTRCVFESYYEDDVRWRSETEIFHPLFAKDFRQREMDAISSSGYVLHTLEASLWCLLTTDNYRDCVLKAVNLGGDTDTTGCVAGGLAGVLYGVEAIPADWIAEMARKDDIEQLFNTFTQLIP